MTLRMSVVLHKWIKQEAESEGRTLTSQIIEVLKEKQREKEINNKETARKCK
jgi:hypothetical protein